MEKLSLDNQQIRKHIRAYQKSNKSMKAYCEAKDLSLSTFQYWYYKKNKPTRSRRITGFTEVFTPEAPKVESKPSVEVLLPNGTQINFNDSFSVELLKAFL